MAGRRGGGVCVSADSAAGKADALINIGVEHAPGSFLVEISADSAGLPGPTGRCNNFLVEGVGAQFWASVRHLGRCSAFPAVVPARTLRFSPASAAAEHAEPLGRCCNSLVERVRTPFWASVRYFLYNRFFPVCLHFSNFFEKQRILIVLLRSFPPFLTA